MRICEVSECGNKHYGYGYCHKHYTQFKKHGKILKRTAYDKNNITCKGNVCEMSLYKGRGEQRLFVKTIFNKRHFKKISNKKWGSKNGYAVNGKPTTYLHHLIILKRKGSDVDHIDGNRLNNLDGNLRRVTHQQNCLNSKSKGYCWNKKCKKWGVFIWVNDKNIYLGMFNEEEDAKKTRRVAELKYFGEYARQA